MKELIEFRINNEYAHLLLSPGEGKKNSSNTIIKISRDDPRFSKIGILSDKIETENKDFLFLYSEIHRSYSKTEIDTAPFLQLIIKKIFDPSENGYEVEYDETVSCQICGAGRKQLLPLKINKRFIPKTDISKTLGGEILVSRRFVRAFQQANLQGAEFKPLLTPDISSDNYQLITSPDVKITSKTVAGVNVFNLSEESESKAFVLSNGQYVDSEKEVYKCPNGDTIGLNLLSEIFFTKSMAQLSNDVFCTQQYIGVKRGLLRPETLLICNQAFRAMIVNAELTGFRFEVAHME